METHLPCGDGWRCVFVVCCHEYDVCHWLSSLSLAFRFVMFVIGCQVCHVCRFVLFVIGCNVCHWLSGLSCLWFVLFFYWLWGLSCLWFVLFVIGCQVCYWLSCLWFVLFVIGCHVCGLSCLLLAVMFVVCPVCYLVFRGRHSKFVTGTGRASAASWLLSVWYWNGWTRTWRWTSSNRSSRTESIVPSSSRVWLVPSFFWLLSFLLHLCASLCSYIWFTVYVCPQ